MLRKLPGYLVLRKFSDPPQLSDLSGFTLDEEDFKQLKNCKPGHCEVQLPSEAMEEFLSTIKIHALPPGATIDVVRRERKLGRLGMSFWIDMGIAALATLCALAAHFAEIGLWAVLYVKGFRTTTWVPRDFARGLDRRGWSAFPGRQSSRRANVSSTGSIVGTVKSDRWQSVET